MTADRTPLGYRRNAQVQVIVDGQSLTGLQLEVPVMAPMGLTLRAGKGDRTRAQRPPGGRNTRTSRPAVEEAHRVAQYRYGLAS